MKFAQMALAVMLSTFAASVGVAHPFSGKRLGLQKESINRTSTSNYKAHKRKKHRHWFRPAHQREDADKTLVIAGLKLGLPTARLPPEPRFFFLEQPHRGRLLTLRGRDSVT